MKAYLANALVFTDRDHAIFYNESVYGVKTIDIDNENQALKCDFDISIDESNIIIELYTTQEYPGVDLFSIPAIKIGVETYNHSEEDSWGDIIWSNQFSGYDTKINISSLSARTQTLIDEKMKEIIDNLN